MKLIKLFLLLPMNTAVCERGFSAMNRINSEGRCKLGSTMLNALMCITIDGPSLESFDPQPAVNHWSSEVHRRPGSRKQKEDTATSDSDDYSLTFDSDLELVSDIDDYDN